MYHSLYSYPSGIAARVSSSSAYRAVALGVERRQRERRGGPTVGESKTHMYASRSLWRSMTSWPISSM